MSSEQFRENAAECLDWARTAKSEKERGRFPTDGGGLVSCCAPMRGQQSSWSPRCHRARGSTAPQPSESTGGMDDDPFAGLIMARLP